MSAKHLELEHPGCHCAVLLPVLSMWHSILALIGLLLLIRPQFVTITSSPLDAPPRLCL